MPISHLIVPSRLLPFSLNAKLSCWPSLHYTHFSTLTPPAINLPWLKNIMVKGLDFLCLTESWHQPEGYSAVPWRQLAQSWPSCHDLGLSLIPLPAASSFEVLRLNAKPSFLMTVVLIYRPSDPTLPSLSLQLMVSWFIHSSLVPVYHLPPDIFWQTFEFVHGGTNSGKLQTDL